MKRAKYCLKITCLIFSNWMKLLSEDIYIYPGLMPCGVFQPKCVLDAHSLTHELIHFSESETYIMTSEVQFLN